MYGIRKSYFFYLFSGSHIKRKQQTSYYILNFTLQIQNQIKCKRAPFQPTTLRRLRYILITHMKDDYTDEPNTHESVTHMKSLKI
nr:hypothetical protein F24O1.5 - Arabidopsis thaliana [Arabidopsis thaliana]